MNKQEIIALKPGEKMNLMVASKVFNIPTENAGDKIKDYSCDISAAWSIVDLMMERGFQYTLSYSDDKHMCSFDNLTTHRRYIIHAQSPTEAICKAALLAYS